MSLREPFDVLTYQCNICNQSCMTRLSSLGREIPSCPKCGSTVRMRAIVYLLSQELFGRSLALSDFPVCPDLHGVGLSDWIGYAMPLAHKLGYTNTFYHTEPRLDIAATPDPAMEGTLDFLISSDVFEHITPPVSRGFETVYRLLKPGGVAIFTVPFVPDGQTREHFPELHQFSIEEQGNQRILRNVTRDGREQVFDELLFHGGDGATLEMRLFAQNSLLAEFSVAGFREIKIRNEPDYDHGVYWNTDWSGASWPITARK